MSISSVLQSSWGTVVLVVSSVSFAIASILDIAGVAGPLRIASIVLTGLGFATLAVSTVTAWMIGYSRRRRHRASAEATLRIGDEDGLSGSHESAGVHASLIPRIDTGPIPRAGITAPEVAELGGGGPAAVDGLAVDSDSVDVSSGRSSANGASVKPRLAGKRDLAKISEAGKDAIGSNFFYDSEELEAYVLQQRDAVWCLERLVRGELILSGYAILLALKPITVERIKSGEIASGRHILSSDLEKSIDSADAIYISMVHGFDDSAKLDIGLAALKRIMQSHAKRRPQLVLARQGTLQGGIGMRRLGFERFGFAPFILATYTDNESFAREIARRDSLQERYKMRKSSVK